MDSPSDYFEKAPGGCVKTERKDPEKGKSRQVDPRGSAPALSWAIIVAELVSKIFSNGYWSPKKSNISAL
jgi:hypothetical protein